MLLKHGSTLAGINPYTQKRIELALSMLQAPVPSLISKDCTICRVLGTSLRIVARISMT